MTRVKIYFFKWDNVYSRAIRMVTGDEWTHIGIGYEQDGESIIYEALSKGFNKFTYKTSFIRSSKHVLEHDTSMDIDKGILIDTLNQHVGKNYAWEDILNLFLMRVLRLKKPLLKLGGPRRLICSEVVALVLKELKMADLGDYYGKKEDYITPQEVYDYYF